MIDAFLRGSYRKRCFTDGQSLYVVSIRKIQTSLNRRHRADKLRSDVYTLLAKRPTGHPLGLLPLCLGLCVNQVGQTLHRGKIQLSVDKSPPSKLSRFSGPDFFDR